MKKTFILICISALASLSSKAVLLLQDSTNYPYADGSIEGQGQWYCFYPAVPYQDALVTNNVLLLNTTNHDEVATPTNGFSVVNPGTVTFASFTINVSALPSLNGGYYFQFQDNSNNNVCHIFVDRIGTVVPGTYRLGIANFATSITSLGTANYPLDLSTGVTYQVVVSYDKDENAFDSGGTLWVNPASEYDYNVYPTDSSANPVLLDIGIKQVGFSPYVNAGISNVVIGTTFDDVIGTPAPPAFGIQPQSGTNYSGNSTTLYAVASGVDVAYQWYSTTYGMLSDNANIIGSTSNTLVLNNLSASDGYYAVATDINNNTATSMTATETVDTTPTAPFFPPSGPGEASTGGLNLTNNVFNSSPIVTNLANGSGPLTYQWYYAPTNAPASFALLPGQTSPVLTFPSVDYTNAGNYYVLASNSHGSTPGPTNRLVVLAPITATIDQLHSLMKTNYTSTITLSPNVTVSGRVTTFAPFTASGATYAEFYIQDGTGGTYIYFPTAGSNNPALPGQLVTVTGVCQQYSGQLEIVPDTAIFSTDAPAAMPAPQALNYSLLATNSLGSYAIQEQCSLATFTNIYIYTNSAGGGPNGSVFNTAGYNNLWITQGAYDPVTNTNLMKLFVLTRSDLGTNFWGKTIPSHAYQLTGIITYYGGYAELDVTRFEDFVTNAPASFTASMTQNGAVSTLHWPAQTGSTYSVYSSSNLLGPWTQTFGLSYYPVTGTFAETNHAPAEFYRISTP